MVGLGSVGIRGSGFAAGAGAGALAVPELPPEGEGFSESHPIRLQIASKANNPGLVFVLSMSEC
jgi:hypothetical protein